MLDLVLDMPENRCLRVRVEVLDLRLGLVGVVLLTAGGIAIGVTTACSSFAVYTPLSVVTIESAGVAVSTHDVTTTAAVPC